MSPGLFEEVRRRVALQEVVAKIVGKPMVGRADERRSSCPLCGAGDKTGSTPFKVSVGSQTWYCHACQRRGDAVDIQAELERQTPRQAAEALLGGGYQPPAAKAAVERPDDSEARKALIAAELWGEARGIIGSPAETYLLGRGIAPEAVTAAAEALKYHPFAKHHWSGSAWVKAPAMIAKAQMTSGWWGGVHATYLARDGGGKADLAPAKRMWGPQKDPAGRPGGAVLVDAGPDADLVVAEGIETTLSLAAWLKAAGTWPLTIVAALSLNRLQGGLGRDAEGCIDVYEPQGDPGRPPFLWHAPAPPRGVWIGIDRDMGLQTLRGRTGRGKLIDFAFDAEARARICARLAQAAWLDAGAAWARPLWPGVLGDWNDRVRRGRVA